MKKKHDLNGSELVSIMFKTSDEVGLWSGSTWSKYSKKLIFLKK